MYQCLTVGQRHDTQAGVLSQAASMVNTKEIPPEAILLGVYLELQNGTCGDD